MKFKNKIIISFCIIIFVPIFLATLVLFSMQHIQMRAIEQTYGVEGDGYSYFSEPVYKRNLSGSIQGGRQPAGETGGWSIP